MEKTRVEYPKVTCGTCRKFDGFTWCKHWNHFTTADSPPCRFYTVSQGEKQVDVVDSSEYKDNK